MRCRSSAPFGLEARPIHVRIFRRRITVMRRSKIFITAVVLLAAALCAQAAFAGAGKAKKSVRTATFKVRIENVSTADGQIAKDGTRWPFALSPGLYVASAKPVA